VSFGIELQDELVWRTATYSTNGNCVEVAPLPDGRGIAVRDSKNRDGGLLCYTPSEWQAFIAGVKDGEFDFC
jgi:hypothetical protein